MMVEYENRNGSQASMTYLHNRKAVVHTVSCCSSGEKWMSFCAGKSGSPGGPIAIATIVLIIADDLQRRNVDRGNQPAVATNAVTTQEGGSAKGGKGGGRRAGGGGGRGHGRAAFADRMAARASTATNSSTEATRAELIHNPSEVEAAANQDSLKAIRLAYGSRAQTLINVLLAFDAYFAWYYPFRESIPYMCPMDQREERALDNCRRAIDMQESFERVAIHNHGSFLPHGAVFKVTRDILTVADVHAHDLSALELQNADSKRVFETGGARHMQFSHKGTTHKKRAGDDEHRLVVTKGYGATAATSVLFKIVALKKLRQSTSIPQSRRAERLFGAKASGRSKLIKLEFASDKKIDYDPAKDTCVDAFVRLLAGRMQDDEQADDE